MPGAVAKKYRKPATADSRYLKFEQTALGSGLVAETLLVAVLLHALLALVLVDFRFTAFLDGAHGVCCRCYVTVKKSGNDFVERIFDDALRP
jgi:hypothetical protein